MEEKREEKEEETAEHYFPYLSFDRPEWHLHFPYHPLDRREWRGGLPPRAIRAEEEQEEALLLPLKECET